MDLSEEGIRTLIFQLDPYEFEELIAELLEVWGWESVVTSGSNDKGKDILVSKSVPFAQEYAIQVKQNSKGNKIGSPQIQQYSSIQNQEETVDGVVVITTSSFTSQAHEMSATLGVKLVDGGDLIKLFENSDGQEVLKRFFDIPSDPSAKFPPPEELREPEAPESHDGSSAIREEKTLDELREREPPEIHDEGSASGEKEAPEELRERDPLEGSTESEKTPEQVFDAICERYGRELNNPTKLDSQSCPKCSGDLFHGKIMYMRESKNVKFCTSCETVFIEKENGWKEKPVYL